MKNSAVVKECASILAGDFALQPIDPAELSHTTLLKQLQSVIKHLLDHDLNGLLNILYRIDVSETLVKDILTRSDPSMMSLELAEAIIIRTYQKAESRIRYRE